MFWAELVSFCSVVLTGQPARLRDEWGPHCGWMAALFRPASDRVAMGRAELFGAADRAAADSSELRFRPIRSSSLTSLPTSIRSSIC